MTLLSSFMTELKSGKTAIYGQWVGWISGILLLIFGITQFLAIPVFAIIAFVEGAFIFLLECPFITKCLRGTDRLLAISNDNRLKCGIYVVFATVMYTLNSLILGGYH